MLRFRRVDESEPPPPQTVLSRSYSSRFVVYVLRGGAIKTPMWTGASACGVWAKRLRRCPETTPTARERNGKQRASRPEAEPTTAGWCLRLFRVFSVALAQFSSGSMVDTLRRVLFLLSLLFKTNKNQQCKFWNVSV